MQLGAGKQEAKVGMLVYRWHDSGAFGMQIVFGHIRRINRKTVTVEWEGNSVTRSEPQNVYAETHPPFIAEVEAQYFADSKR